MRSMQLGVTYPRVVCELEVSDSLLKVHGRCSDRCQSFRSGVWSSIEQRGGGLSTSPWRPKFSRPLPTPAAFSSFCEVPNGSLHTFVSVRPCLHPLMRRHVEPGALARCRRRRRSTAWGSSPCRDPSPAPPPLPCPYYLVNANTGTVWVLAPVVGYWIAGGCYLGAVQQLLQDICSFTTTVLKRVFKKCCDIISEFGTQSIVSSVLLVTVQHNPGAVHDRHRRAGWHAGRLGALDKLLCIPATQGQQQQQEKQAVRVCTDEPWGRKGSRGLLHGHSVSIPSPPYHTHAVAASVSFPATCNSRKESIAAA